jgi:hypothetical protein
MKLIHSPLKSFSKMDLSNEQFNIHLIPLSDKYGSIIFEHKVTGKRYDCKLVVTDLKYRITAVMTGERSWFGLEGHLIAMQMLWQIVL